MTETDPGKLFSPFTVARCVQGYYPMLHDR